MPNPAGLGALAATLNFFPIIGPVAMFVILTVVGVITFSTLGAGLIAPLAFVGLTFLEGHFHHRPQTGTERTRGVHGACVLDLVVGTDGRVSVIAAFDRV